MTDFDLPINYIEDPEALIRKTRARLKKVPALESKDNHTRRNLIPVFEAMTMLLSSSQLSSTWCKLASFVERHMKM